MHARRIVSAREAGPIRTTQHLAQVVGRTHLSPKGGGRKGDKALIHPATRTFQAGVGVGGGGGGCLPRLRRRHNKHAACIA